MPEQTGPVTMEAFGFRLWINPMLEPFPEAGTYLVLDGLTYRVVLAFPRLRQVVLRRTSPRVR